LIKDFFYGNFSTVDITKYWDVDILDVGNRVFSWGFSKFEPLFLEKKERVLVLDADTIITGKLLELLEQFEEDFIVSGRNVTEDFQVQQYYDPTEIEKFDPAFKHPGYAFNSGQMVLTTGIFKRSDFDELVEFTNPPRLKHEQLFKYGDQGLFNYFLFKQNQLGKISLRSIPFMISGDDPIAKKLQISNFENYDSTPLIIHWAGIRKKLFCKMPSGHLLGFLEQYFYQGVPLGLLRKWFDWGKVFILPKVKELLKEMYLQCRHLKHSLLNYKHMSRVCFENFKAIDFTEKNVPEILKSLIKGNANFQCVQIGSNDGMCGDPIFHLLKENRGWKGLLIEPVPFLFKRLKMNYGTEERFSFENALVSDRDGNIPFYYLSPEDYAEIGNDGDLYNQLGSLSRKHLIEAIGAGKKNYIKKELIKSYTLEALLKRNDIERVDLLHMDVESAEFAILKNVDLGKFTPRIIVLEHKHLQYRDVFQMLKKLNQFYIITANSDDLVAVRKD
jgi:FkbM family methyltransferase